MHDGTKIRTQAGADTVSTGEDHPGAVGAGAPSRGADGGSAGARSPAGSAEAGGARTEGTLGSGSGGTDRAAGKHQECGGKSRGAGERARAGSAADEARGPRHRAQLQRADQHRVGEQIIVGAHLSQCSSDAQSLLPAVEEVVKNLENQPRQVVVDGGYTNRDNIIQCAAQQIDLVGSMADPRERSAAAMKSHGIDPAFAPSQFKILEEGQQLECPAGCGLEHVRQSRKRGDTYQQYQARGEDCRACRYQPQCCPQQPERGRTVSIRITEQADVRPFASGWRPRRAGRFTGDAVRWRSFRTPGLRTNWDYESFMCGGW